MGVGNLCRDRSCLTLEIKQGYAFFKKLGLITQPREENNC